MKRSQRARRIPAREQARRRRQQREAQAAEQERQAHLAVLVNEHDVRTSAASASGVHRIPLGTRGLLTGGAQTMTTRTQARGR